MKGFVAGPIVSGLTVLFVFAAMAYARNGSVSPFVVSVAIKDDATGEVHTFYEAMATDQTGKANYAKESWKSFTSPDQVDVTVKVDRPKPLGAAEASAHFVIATVEGNSTLDLPLLVWNEKPDQKQWMKLDGHFHMTAYRCRTVIMM